MLNIILYISTFLITISYLGYIILILIGRNKIISQSNSFDITKDIISEYDRINIIESKKHITTYNLKRKVIKLATTCYYGKDLSSISISLIESGISANDNDKNKILSFLKNIFSNIKQLYIFPLIAVFINHSTFTINDAKVSIIIMFIISIFSYITVEILKNSLFWVNKNLSKLKKIEKTNRQKIINFMNIIVILNEIIFYGELLIIGRMILILLQII